MSQSTAKAIVELKDVSFSYDTDEQTPALSHVSMRVNQGDFLGIIGPSGAGKSTLAAVMSGAIPHHYRGTLYGATLVEGKDTCEVTLTDISQVVGSVLQDIDTQMVASVVEDEMLFGLENFGVDHDQIPARIQQTLETVGIADLRDREIATLSGGQKQKVAIAAILAMRPRVLVLDEPTAALDPASSRLVFDTLRQINRQEGITVVVIEQKVALLCEYCNRVAVLNQGQLVLQGTPHEVFQHPDELRRIGVDSPRVARVYNSLVQKGIAPAGSPCLNVQEAATLIHNLVQKAGKKDTGAPGTKDATGTNGATDASSAPGTGAPSASDVRRFRAGSRHAVPARPHAEGAEPVVYLKDVCFAYPNGGATVDDLCMSVYPGEVVGIVGQNGAGKTTLTKLLNGLLRPSSGQVRIAGIDTKDVPTSRIAAHCATLFQNPDYQLCRDTVLDEVAFGLELHGTPTDQARQRAQAVIDRFGLPAGEAPFSLSRGQRQMVALASVVVMEPDVVLLDEPTSGLDYRECMTVMDTVSQMAQHGCAVIMVCHDMEVVSDFAERIVVMANGRILDRGQTGQTFAKQDLMRRASVAPPQIIQLSLELARTTSPDFAGISQVSGIVDLTQEMVCHD
ncbi:MAG: ABC transporter ATP-binding protein [Atopobiaceae bacterium]